MFSSSVNSVHSIMPHHQWTPCPKNVWNLQAMNEGSPRKRPEEPCHRLPHPARGILPPLHALGTRCRVGGGLACGSRSLVPASLIWPQCSFASFIVYPRPTSSPIRSQGWSLTVQPPASEICWDYRRVPPCLVCVEPGFLYTWQPCHTELCPSSIPSFLNASIYFVSLYSRSSNSEEFALTFRIKFELGSTCLLCPEGGCHPVLWLFYLSVHSTCQGVEHKFFLRCRCLEFH